MSAHLTDDFRGDDAALVRSIEALICLSDEGALVPHGIGGHARSLLSAAAVRLAREGQAPYAFPYAIDTSHPNRGAVTYIFDTEEQAKQFVKATRGGRAASGPCQRCGGSKVVDDGEITGVGGVEFNNGPIACVKDCPDCTVQSADASNAATGQGLTTERVNELWRVSFGRDWDERAYGIHTDSARHFAAAIEQEVRALLAAPAAPASEPAIGQGEIIALEWAVMHLERIATTDQQREKLTRLRALAKCVKWGAAPAPAAQAKWNALTDEDRQAAFESLLEGFLKKWGWLHFAKEIERRCKEKNQSGEAGAELMTLRAVAAEYDACIRHMDAGGDFHEFQAIRAAMADQARKGAES